MEGRVSDLDVGFVHHGAGAGGGEESAAFGLALSRSHGQRRLAGSVFSAHGGPVLQEHPRRRLLALLLGVGVKRETTSKDKRGRGAGE